MCVDYTGLNKACPKDPFPLPRIDQIVIDELISIQEREYTVDLIVLPGLAIDVILGMS